MAVAAAGNTKSTTGQTHSGGTILGGSISGQPAPRRYDTYYSGNDPEAIAVRNSAEPNPSNGTIYQPNINKRASIARPDPDEPLPKKVSCNQCSGLHTLVILSFLAAWLSSPGGLNIIFSALNIAQSTQRQNCGIKMMFLVKK